ncbi:MAG: hypothetical protein AVDCRST_MAG90-2507, partial [uncultured Microvirga sp.]
DRSGGRPRRARGPGPGRGRRFGGTSARVRGRDRGGRAGDGGLAPADDERAGADGASAPRRPLFRGPLSGRCIVRPPPPPPLLRLPERSD